MPPTIPINHYGGPRNQQNRTTRPILLFHANIFITHACFKHPNFFKVNVLDCEPNPVKGRNVLQKDGKRASALTQENLAGQAHYTRNPTTSFLTATTLIYAIGAGITAAAGPCYHPSNKHFLLWY